MNVVFIYGPAAAGKLTVARELAKLTGLPVFHNHLIVDAVLSVFDFESAPFVDLRHEMWMAMFRRAADENRSLIFTFAPERSVSSTFPEELIQAIATRGGRVVFIRLTCSPEEQERRIENASRAEFRKLRSLEFLRQLRDQGSSEYPFLPEPDLVLDTEQCTPAESATIIHKFLNS